MRRSARDLPTTSRLRSQRVPGRPASLRVLLLLLLSLAGLAWLLRARAIGNRHAPPVATESVLGFDYPQLRTSRALVARWAAGEDWQSVDVAYAAALARLTGVGAGPAPSPGGATSGGSAGLQAFVEAAFGLLHNEQSLLLACRHDASLTQAWQAGPGSGGRAGPSATGALSNRSTAGGGMSLLLAANFHNSGTVLPSFMVQALRLALLLPPGRLALSVYESGSSDLSRMWLTLLHQLLLPLRVPHTIITGGALAPRQQLGRIQLLAALRNAVLQPWVGEPPQRGSHQAGSAEAPGFAQLAWRSSSHLNPSHVAFVNDVLWCAEDVQRLSLHGADLACGFDFYAPPWGDQPAQQQQQQQQPQHLAGGDNQQEQGWARQGLDDELEPWSLALHPAGGSRPYSNSTSSTPRFYDKWVARDAAGARLVNLPPYVRHAASAAALGAGQPVAAKCCWNGLALLQAEPLSAGLRFRSHRPGECAASECSLLCDDLARVGRRHVVMDPGVRLAYEHNQLTNLQAVASLAGDARSADTGSAMPSLGPLLSWAEVAPASQQLAAAASAHTQQGPDLVECCDLAPGASIVDFRTACHVADRLAVNFTAESMG